MEWDKPSSQFWVLNQKGRNRMRREKEEEGAECDMISTISFIQAKMQHSTAASRILTRTVSVTGIVRALIKEPWYCIDHIMGLNTLRYTLYSAGGTDRSRACILARNMTIWMLPGFSCRDLVAVLAKYIADGAEIRLVVCSVYLPYDFEDPPPPKEFEEFLRYCENENL